MDGLQNEKLRDILLELSHMERLCFLLHTVRLLSHRQIAKELGISKSSVQQYMTRARKKIEQLTK